MMYISYTTYKRSRGANKVNGLSRETQDGSSREWELCRDQDVAQRVRDQRMHEQRARVGCQEGRLAPRAQSVMRISEGGWLSAEGTRQATSAVKSWCRLSRLITCSVKGLIKVPIRSYPYGAQCTVSVLYTAMPHPSAPYQVLPGVQQ